MNATLSGMKTLFLSRRNFLKKASLDLPLSAVFRLAMASASRVDAQPVVASKTRNYFGKGTRHFKFT